MKNLFEEWRRHTQQEPIQEKDDRCTKIAKRKYDVWPSAYASGAVVKCRQGKIWKDINENDDMSLNEEYEALLEKEGLKKWFDRKGAPGKTGGWVDCNAPIYKDGKKTGYKPCGRQEGEKRSKYPACRPTAAQCKSKGKGKKWGKKSKKENKETRDMKNLFENWRRYAKTLTEGVKHDCANHVKENSTGREGGCINHTLLEDGTVTHYDVEFENEIVRGIPVESLTIIEEGSHMHAAKRDDYKHGDKPERDHEEELEEKEFPDLTGDGKVTQADILKGRGADLDDDSKN
jgi:hypothetical protein